ncbi:hypothetical protein ACFO0A_02920 [Novosphingobium tardum]|uniref:Uncharacterized protein n=1 Tax=Novosphingobium tardum TaxID=1538021 RepID=A0ABV8RLR1_9SPHN
MTHSPDKFTPPRPALRADRLDDLQVYKRLHALIAELEDMAERCWSLAAATSLKVVSQLIRTVASGLWRAMDRK